MGDSEVTPGEHTLEHAPFQVETSGTSIEAKVDEIITGNAEVKLELRKRNKGLFIVGTTFLIILLAIAGLLFRLNQIAASNRRTNKDTHAIAASTQAIVNTLNLATGAEAQARQARILIGAIDDIRRSVDCVKLADEGTYPACVEVIDRLDQIRNGLDPFTH